MSEESTDSPPKIFGIGLSKTGTHSLTAALNLLGYRAVHFEYTRKVFSYQNDDIVVHHNRFTAYDAFADTPIARIYRYLDQKFPNAKFILTVRHPQRWEKSFESQFGGHSPTRNAFSRRLHQDLYGSAEFVASLNTHHFVQHNQNALSHFANRPHKLLVMDICDGEGWEQLCPFVNRPLPSTPFPARYVRQADIPEGGEHQKGNSPRIDLR